MISAYSRTNMFSRAYTVNGTPQRERERERGGGGKDDSGLCSVEVNLALTTTTGREKSES